MPHRHLCLALLTLGLLAGCGREAPAPEPPQSDAPGPWGKAGARDPLVEKTKTKEHRERLIERMLSVQADR